MTRFFYLRCFYNQCRDLRDGALSGQCETAPFWPSSCPLLTKIDAAFQWSTFPSNTVTCKQFLNVFWSVSKWVLWRAINKVCGILVNEVFVSHDKDSSLTGVSLFCLRGLNTLMETVGQILTHFFRGQWSPSACFTFREFHFITLCWASGENYTCWPTYMQ